MHIGKHLSSMFLKINMTKYLYACTIALGDNKRPETRVLTPTGQVIAEIKHVMAVAVVIPPRRRRATPRYLQHRRQGQIHVSNNPNAQALIAGISNPSIGSLPPPAPAAGRRRRPTLDACASATATTPWIPIRLGREKRGRERETEKP